jgi:AcrR family transcriptional regulator
VRIAELRGTISLDAGGSQVAAVITTSCNLTERQVAADGPTSATKNYFHLPEVGITSASCLAGFPAQSCGRDARSMCRKEMASWSPMTVCSGEHRLLFSTPDDRQLDRELPLCDVGSVASAAVEKRIRAGADRIVDSRLAERMARFQLFFSPLKPFVFNVSITNMNSTRSYRQSSRAESAAETGRSIIEAFLTRLKEQWFDEITLDQVAEDAGVTVQTVIRRFRGKAGLLTVAIEAMKAHAKERRAAPIGDLDQLVTNLIDDYEQSGDTVIRLLALEERHQVLQEHLELARRWHRTWIANSFSNHLAQLRPRDRNPAVDALVIVTDVYTWKLLRRDMSRSIKATHATIKTMIQSTLSAYLQLNDAK